ncbi:MAG TPA: DUF5996 family protein [Cytophagaceae bacterium]
MNNRFWPELSYTEGKETYNTIHLWTQIIGKVKLATLPWINHSWHVTLTVTPSGLTTGVLPFNGKYFQINIDFLKHQLQISTNLNEERNYDLRSLSVADCYNNLFSCLKSFDIDIKIYPIANELADPIPFPKDIQHRTYIPEIAQALHMALLNTNNIFTEFRSEFIGKSSPVHFFWGGFDLAVSRFSGRAAPLHPGGVPNLPDWVAQEAYSHEVYSCGFWPGGDSLPYAAYYSYIYPEPKGFPTAPVKPQAAFYHNDLKEFILPYKDVQKAAAPAEVLLEFLHSTYNAAAGLANWDKASFKKQYPK